MWEIENRSGQGVTHPSIHRLTILHTYLTLGSQRAKNHTHLCLDETVCSTQISSSCQSSCSNLSIEEPERWMPGRVGGTIAVVVFGMDFVGAHISSC